MIFVTVGHQMPFDRLVRAVDEWAGRNGRRDVFAQIGRAKYVPKNFDSTSFLAPQEFERRMREADGVIAHAGTGTIIAALQLGKPLLVMPRLARLGETRNDHQIPTAERFASAGRVLAAENEEQLAQRIDELGRFQPASVIDGRASPELIQCVRTFVFGARGGA